MKNEPEMNSAEEAARLRASAQAHMDTLKKFWSNFLFTGILTAVIGIIYVGSGLGWFVINTKTEAQTVEVSANMKAYTLASVGERQIEETKYLDESGSVILPEGISKSIEAYYKRNGDSWVKVEEPQEYFLASGSEVAWHLGKETKFFPGCREQFDFYIIPSTDGAQTINFSLDIDPFAEDTDSGRAVEILGNDSLNALLQGHILLFAVWDEGECSDWLASLEGERGEDGRLNTVTGFRNELQIDLPADAEAGVPYRVSIIAVWPKRFQNMIYLGRTNQGDIFTEDQPAYREVSDFIRLQSGKNSLTNVVGEGHSNYLFIMGDNEIASAGEYFIPVMDDYDSMAYVTAMRSGKYYNLADEYIGKQVTYLRITIEDR